MEVNKYENSINLILIAVTLALNIWCVNSVKVTVYLSNVT